MVVTIPLVHRGKDVIKRLPEVGARCREEGVRSGSFRLIKLQGIWTASPEIAGLSRSVVKYATRMASAAIAACPVLNPFVRF